MRPEWQGVKIGRGWKLSHTGGAKSRFQPASLPHAARLARLGARQASGGPSPVPTASHPQHGPPPTTALRPQPGKPDPWRGASWRWQAPMLPSPRAWAQGVTPPVSPSERTGPAFPSPSVGTSLCPPQTCTVGSGTRGLVSRSHRGAVSQLSNSACPPLTSGPRAAWGSPSRT